jgi:hypothetical protein
MSKFIFWANETGKVHIAESLEWIGPDYEARCTTRCNRFLSGHARHVLSACQTPNGGKVTCKRCRMRLEKYIATLTALVPEDD